MESQTYSISIYLFKYIYITHFPTVLTCLPSKQTLNPPIIKFSSLGWKKGEGREKVEGRERRKSEPWVHCPSVCVGQNLSSDKVERRWGKDKKREGGNLFTLPLPGKPARIPDRVKRREEQEKEGRRAISSSYQWQEISAITTSLSLAFIHSFQQNIQLCVI